MKKTYPLLLLLSLFLPLLGCCKPSQKQQNTAVMSAKKPAFQADQHVIVLDPGHGGYDLGARISSCNEKSLALSTALLTKKFLREKGYQVVLTRSRDVFLSLEKRADFAKDSKSHLFVSFHYNSAKNPTANGIEVFYYESSDKWRSTASRKLARIVLSRMVTRTGAVDRGIKEGNFHVIRETKIPAILIEGGFLTNEKERAKLRDSNYRESLALAIAEGIDSYFKSV